MFKSMNWAAYKRAMCVNGRKGALLYIQNYL